MTTATRNVAVGLVIATSNFAGTPAVTAVVAYGLVSILGALGCALLFGRFVAIEPKNAHVASSRRAPRHASFRRTRESQDRWQRRVTLRSTRSTPASG